MKRKKLLIISHTEHYKNQDQEIVGWGATINEVNYLADFWEEVVHIGCLYDSEAPKSALPYAKSNIRFVPIPPYGGKSVKDKILIFFKIPKIVQQVIYNLKGASEVQLRLPTSMGVFLLPLFSFFLPRKYTFWIKYAGNWNQENPSVSYRFQRWWIRKNWARCKVTINGFWENQPEHCFSFENPCLTEDDLMRGKVVAEKKEFEGPFVLAFVGRLEDEKGMARIIEALRHVPLEKIAMVHFIGDGDKRKQYEDDLLFLNGKAVFHGFLSRVTVHILLAESHFFLLPSDSEGFPKVIAEAACNGVIPVVSNVGSISHYINAENGFLWLYKEESVYGSILENALQSPMTDLKEKSSDVRELAEKFTFARYLEQMNKLIFK